MPRESQAQISGVLKRLWSHGVIRKIDRTDKYYATELGRTVITMA